MGSLVAASLDVKQLGEVAYLQVNTDGGGRQVVQPISFRYVCL